jgi:hypothetical protein
MRRVHAPVGGARRRRSCPRVLRRAAHRVCTEFIRSMAWRGRYPIGERFFARVLSPERDQRARGGTRPRRLRRAGQLNVSGPVPRKQAPLLNALGSSLPAGQKRERERRPERPRRALLHLRGALRANAVHARVVLAERRRSRKRGGETQRPRRSLSEAAVKKCGVAFPRPRVNGSGYGAACERSRSTESGQIRMFVLSHADSRSAKLTT